MIRLRNQCTGQAPVHFYRKTVGGVLLGLALGAAPLAAVHAAPAAAATPVRSAQTVEDFYRSRNGAPLWLAPASGDAAERLIALLSTANIDRLDPDHYGVAALQKALAAARSGDRRDLQVADRMLSQAFAIYVADLVRDPGLGITYVDPQLKPKPPTALGALLQASAAPSLSNYVRDMGWMNPIYRELRQALADHKYDSDSERERLQLNLERARALPAGKQRYVLVNAAQQRLYMYEDGKAVDSMVVVVGKPKWPTPLLTAYIRFAALNPYWYVPPDLAGEDVGQYVVKYGLKYLDRMGYEVVSDWSRNPTIIDPATIDWKGVVDGKVEVMIRQKPGPENFMGRMKFMFPNDFGVYLHDNPRRELFQKASRYFSGGCVRLEDAARLGHWLFGRDLDWQSAGTEEPVPLKNPVPVYITYLTAMPSEDGSQIAYFDDVYGRDKDHMASADSSAGKVANAATVSSASGGASPGRK
ncbi:MAG TPA: L,D-transpeptidase family protein [Sphingomicrobium sp.]|nr:L,D-transpeptidase family protein [Sphingomicrobium sp.]